MEFTTSSSTAQGNENLFFPAQPEEKKRKRKSKKEKRRREAWINEAKKKSEEELSASVNSLLDDLLPNESRASIAETTFDLGDHFIPEEEALSAQNEKTVSEKQCSSTRCDSFFADEETSLTTYDEKQLTTSTLQSNGSEDEYPPIDLFSRAETSPTYEKHQRTSSLSNTNQLDVLHDDLCEGIPSGTYEKQQTSTCPPIDLYFHEETSPTSCEKQQITQNEQTLRTSSGAGKPFERNDIFLAKETSPPRYEKVECVHEPTTGAFTIQSAGEAQYFAKEMLVEACDVTGNTQTSTSTVVDKVKQSRKHKPREIYNQVEVTHTVKETDNGTILSISVKAPKFLNYAIVNIHKESSCQCVIKDIFPLGTTQHKRSFDMNWNVSKVSKQCKIATNVSQMSE